MSIVAKQSPVSQLLSSCFYMILLSFVKSIIPPADVRPMKVSFEIEFELLKVVISLYVWLGSAYEHWHLQELLKRLQVTILSYRNKS